jgi:hypothetical protein
MASAELKTIQLQIQQLQAQVRLILSDQTSLRDVRSGALRAPAIAKGDRGDRGFPGPKGEKGDPGPQGIQGNQGIQGPRGAPGINGENGQPGAVGPQGPVGPAGSSTLFENAVLASDVTLNNATLATDPTLTLALAANTRHFLWAQLYWANANATPGFQFGFQVSGGTSSVIWTVNDVRLRVSGDVERRLTSTGQLLSVGGIVNVGAGGATLSVQRSQANLDALNVTMLKAGSFISTRQTS